MIAQVLYIIEIDKVAESDEDILGHVFFTCIFMIFIVLTIKGFKWAKWVLTVLLILFGTLILLAR